MYSDAHPAVQNDDPAALRAFLERIEREARRAGTVQLTLGSFATPGHRDILQHLGYELKDRYEFSLSLEKPQEEMWAAMEERRRRSVRKAEKSGVLVEPLMLKEGLPELSRLLAVTGTRLQQRGAEVEFGNSLLDSAIAMLVQSGKASVIGARYQGTIVSAVLMIDAGHMAYYSLAGHSQDSFDVHAPTLLLWRTILRYQASGAKWFNFGGVSFSAADPAHLEHGLYCFKKGFGGAPELCTTGTKVLRPAQQEVIARLQAIRAHAKR
jgi:lipid II:glycine glycyltransferase (peptidoglycan interpeptide bridge formation enzyme)